MTDHDTRDGEDTRDPVALASDPEYLRAKIAEAHRLRAHTLRRLVGSLFAGSSRRTDRTRRTREA